jgi:formate hydrogenlyase transcriptional activator
MPPSAEQVEEVLRFARKLEMHSDHEQLLRALPAELCVMVDSSTTALIYWHEGQLTTRVVDSDCCTLATDHLATNGTAGTWPEAVWQAISEREQALVLPALEQPSPDANQRFSEAIRFFREYGNQSLCLLPLSTALRRLGALCIGRKHRDAFSEQEVNLLSLISHYAALAIDDRLNFAQSEQVRAQLEKERTKLRLILDLNNSVVSNLELRDVIQSISPGIRACGRGGPDPARQGGSRAPTVRVGFSRRQFCDSPGFAGFTSRFSCRAGVSFGKAMDRGYRAVAKSRTGPQSCVRGRSGDPMYVAFAPG